MSELVANVANVIFEFGNSKRKTHKVFRNISPSKNFKNICFWNKKIEKQTKIGTHINL
jgi:hypothetical protein